ncbi:MFS transporter [Evansella cellulosilytica]|uniref:Major facilitator superfamily MFS_1 n=1 Tax=Evansella cellulosilytica (strain ATCC 21833 / DSM 2522 / FERM P-1141 / JCM 9156 / N-4) TaxID=649639 RepID=E6TV51_EVAC2|nr:MFS transporter [Evansella cellulosilytica]ADU29735.1 major facilitator superfamily MFS_1 [Evansella cellulosilytica DSM 2522]
MNSSKEKGVLFLILFLIFVSIHMQFPVFTPLAVSLGAGSFLVGVMLSTTSFINLTGNIVAGSFIDRFGTKIFIVFPLLLLSLSLFAHTFITETYHLFLLRVINGFILAFLTPACMTMLSSFAKNSHSQSKNMAMNTFVVTIAMTIAPVLGGMLGDRFGSTGAYFMISVITFISFLLAVLFLTQKPLKVSGKQDKKLSIIQFVLYKPLLPVFLAAFALMFAQGTLMYELPFLSVEQGMSKDYVGRMAGVMGLGTLCILMVVFLHYLTARIRAFLGLIMLSTALCWMMFSGSIPPFSSLLLFGASIGITMPAIMTLVTDVVSEGNRGKAFAFLSAVFSVGTITSPFIAGLIRSIVSPYFIAWIVLMFVIIIYGMLFFKVQKKEEMTHN